MNRPNEAGSALGRAFVLLWIGESAFGLAQAILQFSLGVWVYQHSGSVERFAGVVLASLIPALVFTPLAGALADYFDRRSVIFATDLGFAVTMVLLAELLFTGALRVEHLYVLNSVGAVLTTLRTPSYQSAVSRAIPADSLTRATAFIGLSHGAMQLIAPLIGGGLMARLGLRGIMPLEIALVLSGGLAVFRALSYPQSARSIQPSSTWPPLVGSIKSGVSGAIGYFRQQPLMFGLLVYVVIHQGLLVLASVMLTPLVLSTHSSRTLGLVDACGAAGGLAGALVLVMTNARKHLMALILGLDACLSVCVLIVGWYASAPVWCACAFVALFAGSASEACAMALWMRKTPQANRGNIFSMVGGITLLTSAAVVLIGGFLSENLFEPGLAAGGPWAATVGQWFGTGKGRGLGFMFAMCGALCGLVSLLAFAHSGLRHLDELVADLPEGSEI